MSLFKRLFRDKEELNVNSIQTFTAQHTNIKALGSNLQKRFSRGVQYNMKILIRGDRNVGKSALLNRLKGGEFIDQYIPTEEIEVACIHWTYKSTEDIVKVEVWDVVDKGRKKTSSGLKLENNNNIEEAPKSLCLDAQFLDVYKGAHGVILVLDMTKSWTFNYVERELSKLPEDMPVLVLANHRDMGHHRTVTGDQVMALLEPLPGFKKGLIKYWESSMKNGYGLVYIHKFLGIPFLMLQRDTLLKQLLTNEHETQCALEEMEEFEECPDNIYDNFIGSLVKPSSLALHSGSGGGGPSSQVTSPSSPQNTKEALTPVIYPPQARPIPGMEKLGLYPLPVPTNGDVTSTPSSEHSSKDVPPFLTDKSPKQKKEIFDFVPDEQPELSMFLDDSSLSPGVPVESNIRESSSEDGGDDCLGEGSQKSSRLRCNPMVAVFQDDIDCTVEQDIVVPAPQQPSELSSSEDEQDTTYSSVANSSTLSKKSVENGVRKEVETSSVTRTSPTVAVVKESSPPIYSEIVFNSADLDILEQISSKKEVDTDEITVTSSSSVTKKKTKTKKHHKKSETKESKKKKKKSSKKSEEEEEEKSSHIEKSQKQSKKHLKSPVKTSTSDNVSSVVNGDSSDSLEKFLNE